MDSIIESRELQIERKLFSIDLRENGRGKFLRITEDSQGHRNVIIVPISGVDDFADAIDDVLASEPAEPVKRIAIKQNVPRISDALTLPHLSL